MNCKNCKNWVFGRCVVSNLVVGPDMLCNAWELSQSHEMVTMPFATFDDKELQERIAELEAEVLELKPYRDGYDANENYPEEKEKVFAKTKHGIFVAQHKFDNWYNMFGVIVTDEIECWWKIPGTWK